MTSRVVWACVVCGFKAEERPPRHCPGCGVNAAKFRMVVDRAPAPAAIPSEAPKESPKESPTSEPAPEGEPKREALAS